MSNTTLTNLLKEYENKKYNADLDYERKKSSFYNSHPELSDLNSKLGKLGLDISKAVLKKDSVLEQKLKLEFEELKIKKEELLISFNAPNEVLSPTYECSICNDTGFVLDNNGKSVLCNCIKQKMFDIDFNKSNIRKS